MLPTLGLTPGLQVRTTPTPRHPRRGVRQEFPSLDKEGLGVVYFRADPLFSYTFWLCSLNFVTQTPFGSRAASSHDPPHPRREPTIGLIAVVLQAKGAKLAALKKVTSFVFKHFLASFPRFFVYLSYPAFPERPGRLQHAPRLAAHRRSATTRCPQNEHSDRLPYRAGLVKRKTCSGAI